MAAGSESLDARVSCVVGGFGGHLRLLANWRPRERGASQTMPGVANPARAGWSPGSGRLTLPPCRWRWDLGGCSVVSRQVLRRRAAVADRVFAPRLCYGKPNAPGSAASATQGPASGKALVELAAGSAPCSALFRVAEWVVGLILMAELIELPRSVHRDAAIELPLEAINAASS